MAFDQRQCNGPGTETMPLDLAYLRLQICDDRALEVELLGLFSQQAHRIVDQLARSSADATDDRQRHADLLHTLCGSARAVGAWEVAHEAERLERAERTGLNGDPLSRSVLARAVARACEAIACATVP